MPDAPDPSPGQFPPTRWTLVHRAGGSTVAGNLEALTEIVRLYAPALRAHLLQRTRGDSHRADDLLQGFLAEKVLEQRLIGYADPARGRFRTFLLAALDRYVIDEHRRASAQKRSPRSAMEDIDDRRDTLPADQESAFDQAWAREVLDEVLTRMRAECESGNRADLWQVFEVRYLKPALEGAEPEPHDSIARRLQLESAHHATNLLTTAKRMFTRIFKSVIARYAIDDEEIRSEAADLWRIYANHVRPSR